MGQSVLQAIRDGHWNFEPPEIPDESFDCTEALPGSDEKLKALANRIVDGLPLWHPDDRQSFDDTDRALD